MGKSTLEILEYTTMILSEDWSEYNAIKERNDISIYNIDFSKRWELVFLEKIISKHFPNIPIDDIILAVYYYGKHHSDKCQRHVVVKHLLETLLN